MSVPRTLPKDAEIQKRVYRCTSDEDPITLEDFEDTNDVEDQVIMFRLPTISNENEDVYECYTRQGAHSLFFSNERPYYTLAYTRFNVSIDVRRLILQNVKTMNLENPQERKSLDGKGETTVYTPVPAEFIPWIPPISPSPAMQSPIPEEEEEEPSAGAGISSKKKSKDKKKRPTGRTPLPDISNISSKKESPRLKTLKGYNLLIFLKPNKINMFIRELKNHRELDRELSQLILNKLCSLNLDNLTDFESADLVISLLISGCEYNDVFRAVVESTTFSPAGICVLLKMKPRLSEENLNLIVKHNNRQFITSLIDLRYYHSLVYIIILCMRQNNDLLEHITPIRLSTADLEEIASNIDIVFKNRNLNILKRLLDFNITRVIKTVNLIDISLKYRNQEQMILTVLAHDNSTNFLAENISSPLMQKFKDNRYIKAEAYLGFLSGTNIENIRTVSSFVLMHYITNNDISTYEEQLYETNDWKIYTKELSIIHNSPEFFKIIAPRGLDDDDIENLYFLFDNDDIEDIIKIMLARSEKKYIPILLITAIICNRFDAVDLIMNFVNRNNIRLIFDTKKGDFSSIVLAPPPILLNILENAVFNEKDLTQSILQNSYMIGSPESTNALNDYISQRFPNSIMHRSIVEQGNRIVEQIDNIRRELN